ncbi:hypothetical protein [Rubritalea sp.]|uniref:hypothetical protein n=1 Tax=Rubritalea sp. TaxID=2109375 RepID=UPI003EF99CB7
MSTNTKNKNMHLFIAAHMIEYMINRTLKKLNARDIAVIAKTYHAWRGERNDGDTPIKRFKLRCSDSVLIVVIDIALGA